MSNKLISYIYICNKTGQVVKIKKIHHGDGNFKFKLKFLTTIKTTRPPPDLKAGAFIKLKKNKIGSITSPRILSPYEQVTAEILQKKIEILLLLRLNIELNKKNIHSHFQTFSEKKIFPEKINKKMSRFLNAEKKCLLLKMEHKFRQFQNDVNECMDTRSVEQYYDDIRDNMIQGSYSPVNKVLEVYNDK